MPEGDLHNIREAVLMSFLIGVLDLVHPVVLLKPSTLKACSMDSFFENNLKTALYCSARLDLCWLCLLNRLQFSCQILYMAVFCVTPVSS